MKQKEKEKREREQEGVKRTPARRKRQVEPGNDDCGDDLSGLGPAIMYHHEYELYFHDDSDDEDEDCWIFDFEDDLDDTLGRGFVGMYLWGSGGYDDVEDNPCLHAGTQQVNEIMFAGSHARRARDIAELVYLADRLPPGDDVCEI